MKRRSFLTSPAICAANAGMLAACSQQQPVDSSISSLPTIHWRMATSWTPSLDIMFGSAEMVCQRVNAMTDGRFSITPYPSGEIVAPLEVLDAVSKETVECGYTSSLFYIKQQSALAFAAGVPFGLSSQQQNTWLYAAGGLETIQNLYANFGIINFPGGDTGGQMGGWFNKKIETIDSFKGLRMRIPGLGGEVMARLGVKVQTLPSTEIMAALTQGKIDAVEWNVPYDEEKLGLHKAAPFYYYPGWWEPSGTLDFLVNLQQWQKLPIEYQKIFQTAAAEAHVKTLAKYNAVNGQVMQRFIASGTQLIPYSQEILQKAKTVTFAMYEELALQNKTFQKVYEPWKKFHEKINNWNRMNAYSFTDFAFNNVD
ncbi:TRAP transporter substrate-binding protein DctP [Candidatus Gracilibacteria bacterium]|nr:TRAP transporter substrate-binding protein DctP [Candidatus Gracilibacteria bacterium]NJM88897.1 TRAP transporter substrate-binding protein DctP [Hydrococcus sp. RU_2_2]NJP19865.1 TRAP transporter substrate-binding protein DctP [Hydrococcus sp. CRU_1_1]NJQ96709.1 TRAP transporter substrate-binding protein DctP [Hydrococcus sp. CSU_1_8]